MTTRTAPPQPDRRIVLALALAADVDLRTAARALTLGLGAIHGVRIQERLTVGGASLGVEFPAAPKSEAKP